MIAAMKVAISLLASVLCLANAAPSQNLLRWDAWKINSTDPRTQMSNGPSGIVFVPIGQGRVGFSQTITTTAPMRVQLHVRGADCSGPTCFRSAWYVGVAGQVYTTGMFSEYQTSVAFNLPAGRHRVSFECDGCFTALCMTPFLRLAQPFLRKVESPAVETDQGHRHGHSPYTSFTANGHLLLAGLRRTSSPIRLPGYSHGLEIDLSSPYLFLAFSPTPRVRFVSYAGIEPPGGFFLQAVRLGAQPAFGSRNYVEPRPW